MFTIMKQSDAENAKKSRAGMLISKAMGSYKDNREFALEIPRSNGAHFFPLFDF